MAIEHKSFKGPTAKGALLQARRLEEGKWPRTSRLGQSPLLSLEQRVPS